MEILNIQTTQLNVRHLKLSDLTDFHIYRSNPEVTKYQGFDVMTIEQAEKDITNLQDEIVKTGQRINDLKIELRDYE